MQLFEPWKRVVSVDKIDLDELEQMGCRLLLLDRDNTCVPRDTYEIPQEIMSWMKEAQARGFKTCLVSNNFHTAQIEESAKLLDCDKIDHAMKPCPLALQIAMAKQGVPKEQTVLIGDQLFTDVFAGSLAGIKTILVKPQSTEDLWYTQIFRIFEEMVSPNPNFEGEDC